MFKDKNFGLPKDLIESARSVMQKQLVEYNEDDYIDNPPEGMDKGTRKDRKKAADMGLRGPHLEREGIKKPTVKKPATTSSNNLPENHVVKFTSYLKENFHINELTEEEIAWIYENEYVQWLEETARSVEKEHPIGRIIDAALRARERDREDVEQGDEMKDAAYKKALARAAANERAAGATRGIQPGIKPTAQTPPPPRRAPDNFVRTYRAPEAPSGAGAASGVQRATPESGTARKQQAVSGQQAPTRTGEINAAIDKSITPITITPTPGNSKTPPLPSSSEDVRKRRLERQNQAVKKAMETATGPRVASNVPSASASFRSAQEVGMNPQSQREAQKEVERVLSTPEARQRKLERMVPKASDAFAKDIDDEIADKPSTPSPSPAASSTTPSTPSPSPAASSTTPSTTSRPAASARREPQESDYQAAKRAVPGDSSDPGATATERLKYMAGRRNNKAAGKALTGPPEDWRKSVFEPND